MDFTPDKISEEAYTAWLLEEETSPVEHKQIEARYTNDAAFRTETDQLRAAANFLTRNIDPLLILIEPESARLIHERDKAWEELQRRKQVKRQQEAVRSSRAQAAQWGDEQWDKFKENLEVLVSLAKQARDNAAIPSTLSMQAASNEADLQTAQIEGDPQSWVPVRVLKREVRGTETGGTVRLELVFEDDPAKQFAGWFLAMWLDAGVEGWLEIGGAPVSSQGRVNAVLREDRFPLPAELSERLRFTLRPTSEWE